MLKQLPCFLYRYRTLVKPYYQHIANSSENKEIVESGQSCVMMALICIDLFGPLTATNTSVEVYTVISI